MGPSETYSNLETGGYFILYLLIVTENNRH